MSPGAAEHAIPVKPISAFLPRFEALIARVMRTERPRAHRARRGRRGRRRTHALAGSAARREVAQAGHDPGGLDLHPVSGSARYPARVSGSLSAALSQHLRRAAASRVVTGARVTRGRGRASCIAGREPTSRRRDSLDHAQPPPRRGSQRPALRSMTDGFVKVDASLRAEGQRRLFAAGDIDRLRPADLPKSGVYAVRAGPVLAENIRRTLTGGRCGLPPAARSALSRLDRRAHAVGDAQRPRGRRRLGLALEGLHRPPLHAAVQRAPRDARRAARPDLAARR